MVPREVAEEIGFDRAMLIVFGHAAFQLAWSGVELGLFELLQERGALAKAEIGEALGLGELPTAILVDGATGLGLLSLDAGLYALTSFADRALTRGGDSSLVDVMGWQHHICYPAYFHLATSLREDRAAGLDVFPEPGDTLYQRLANVPALEEVFQRAMAGMPSNRFIGEALPLEGVQHLVDLGGGAGRNAMALARAHPGLRVTVMDQPSVCERAAANIAAAGLSDRVGVHPGDMFTDPFPEGAQAVLLSHIGSIWSQERNLAVFRRVRERLEPGGRLYVYNMVCTPDGTGPLPGLVGSAYFLGIAGGRGMVWPAEVYVELMRRAGFESIESHDTPVDHAVVVGTVP